MINFFKYTLTFNRIQRYRWPHWFHDLGTQRLHRSKTNGSTSLHGLCMLGSNRFFRNHRSSGIPPHHSNTHEDPVGILLSIELVRKSLSLRTVDPAIQKRFLHSHGKVRFVQGQSGATQRGDRWQTFTLWLGIAVQENLRGKRIETGWW